MENASKALIIAGAILLAILIISLGILIYNQASGIVSNNSMDEVDIQTFNNKFTQYGGNQRGIQPSGGSVAMPQVFSGTSFHQRGAFPGYGKVGGIYQRTT